MNEEAYETSVGSTVPVKCLFTCSAKRDSFYWCKTVLLQAGQPALGWAAH